MTHRRFLIAFGVVFSALSLLTLVVVAVVDPYNRFRTLEEARTEGAYRRNYETNAVLWEMIRLDRISPSDLRDVELVILGDSRGDQLSDDIDSVLGIKVLNLSMGGAELNESLSIFEKYRAAIPTTARLLITSPYERASNLPSFDRVDELSNVAVPLRYLTNGFVIKRSYLTLLGSFPIDLKESEEERKLKLRADIIAKWQVLLDEPPHTDRFFARVVPLIDGREAAFYLPPVDDAIRNHCMDRSMCRSNVEKMIVELERHGRVFDFFTQPELDGKRFEFSDPVHVAQPKLILRHIIAECFPVGPNP